ncbi:MAG: hypothetical protein LW822_10910 [Phycisphaeraceae bacterium]|nr:hypothetical protein [Phycisphaeraceae bacterium]
MHKTILAALAIATTTAPHAHASPFATRVVSYTPGPGATAGFTNPAAAIGPPLGGSTSSPDNSKLVSLGSLGGSITLAFDEPIPNLSPSPANPLALDLIVFGNAFYVANNPNRRFAEPGIIEVSRDTNANGLADDHWFVIPGSHLTLPTSTPLTLPQNIFTQNNFPILNNPLGQDATNEGALGYADCTPTIALGDLDADGIIDAPLLNPDRFYTSPDDPTRVGISPFTGGGDAVDISAARNPTTGDPANLTTIDFVRITTALTGGTPALGPISTDLAAVARVIVRPRADIAGPGQSPGPDGQRTADDIILFLNWFFSTSPLADIASPGQTPGPDGNFTADDIIVYLNWFFAPE